jgi:hypothetical protein
MNTAAFGESSCLNLACFSEERDEMDWLSRNHRALIASIQFSKRMEIQAISTLGTHPPKREVKSIGSNRLIRSKIQTPTDGEISAILYINRFDFM